MSEESRVPTPWEVPPTWSWRRVGDVTAVVGGGTPSTQDSDNWSNGTIPWITPADLSGYHGKYISGGDRSITPRGLETSGARLMPAGTVLFSSRAPIGYVVIAAQPVSTNQGFKSFVPSEALLPDYVYYFLKGNKELALQLASGTTFLEISGKKAAQIPIPIAPLAEQRRIVDAIEEHLPRIDAAGKAFRRVQANLKRYRAAVLKVACEGRLVPTEAQLARQEGREYERADVLLERVLAERRARWEAEELKRLHAQGAPPKNDNWKRKYRTPEGPFAEQLPACPEGWTWTTVEQAAHPEKNSITDGPFGSNLKTAHYTSSGPRVVRLQNVGDGSFVDEGAHISEAHFRKLTKHEVFAGDLVIAALGHRPPRACLIPTWLGPAIVKADCIRLKVDERVLLPEYANIVLNAEPTKGRMAGVVHGVGRPRLNLVEVKSIPIPLPPLPEQRRIVRESERRLSVLAMLEKSVERDLAWADRLRQSILKRAFEGKLVPQDPRDEPASALLERILDERAGTVRPIWRRRPAHQST